MSRLFTIGALLTVLIGSLILPTAGSSQSQQLRLLTQFIMSNTSKVKFPQVTVTGTGQNTLVHLVTNNSESDALYFNKGETASQFSDPFFLGFAEGQGDYSNVSVTPAPDGAIYVAWINNEARTVYLRRLANGVWGPTRIVDTITSFPYGVDLVVSSNGTIFVAWLGPNQAVRFRTSTDQGVNWSQRGNVSDIVAFRDVIDLAAGPNGQVAISFTGSIEPISVVAGVWNGSFFDTRVVSGNAASSSLNFAPDGKLYVAFRGTDESGGNSGMFYAERQANGEFPSRSRLAGGSVSGPALVDVDVQGNLHFAWMANASGDPELYYTFAGFNAGGTPNFATPIVAPRDGVFLANANGFANISDATYFHVAAEAFTGNTSRVRYHLFAGGATTVNAQPTIEGGAPTTNRPDNQVSVGFQVTGPTPNQIRWRWGAAPSDTLFDSSGAQGWVAFSNPMTIPVPERIRGLCDQQTLYTQTRVVGGVTETTVKSDSITIDNQVNPPGTLFALNPYSYEALNDPTPNLSSLPEPSSNRANAGDTLYTRVDAVNIEIENNTDCTDLDTVQIGKTADNLTSPAVIVNNRFDQRIFFPTGSLTEGRNDFIIRLKDKAGNSRDFPATIYYDDREPALNTTQPGTVTVTLDPQATLLVDLTFSDINVTDGPNGYTNGGRQFWGAWVAISRTPTDPFTDNTLVWSALPAPGTSSSFTINDFSLASGLPSNQVSAGDYYLYVRFLDGAGNATIGFLPVTVNLPELTRPAVYAPLIRK